MRWVGCRILIVIYRDTRVFHVVEGNIRLFHALPWLLMLYLPQFMLRYYDSLVGFARHIYVILHQKGLRVNNIDVFAHFLFFVDFLKNKLYFYPIFDDFQDVHDRLLGLDQGFGIPFQILLVIHDLNGALFVGVMVNFEEEY